MTVSRHVYLLALFGVACSVDDPPLVGESEPSQTVSSSGGGVATMGGEAGTSTTSAVGTSAEDGSSGDASDTTTGTTGGGEGVEGGEGGTGEPVPFDELSDEFDDPATLQGWTLRSDAEGTTPQHSVLDVDMSTPGHLTLVPLTSGWFREYRGLFLYKLVEGDFVVETWVEAAHVDNPSAAPTEQYNSGGIMVRDPEYGPGQENWIAHNVGMQLTTVGTENKNTVDSRSELWLFSGSQRGRLRICRLGSTFILLRQLEGEATFTETFRFERSDLPDVVQVGPMANGWNSGGNDPDLERTPDVRATFDYIRIWQPEGEASCSADEPASAT